MPEISAESMAAVVERVDELFEIDPSDTRLMFWKEMKCLFFAMREIEPDDLDEGIMDDFLAAMDQVSNVLGRIEKRRRESALRSETMRI